MSLKSLSDYTFASRYARYDKTKKRRETWHEAIERVKNMHLFKYPMAADDINWAFEHVHNKVALGSQRALQFGGDPILKRNAKIYNCISAYCDRPRFFQECTWLLLNGCGSGFSVQQHHIAKLPDFHITKSTDLSEEKIYKIDDSIEGWSDALGVLTASYIPHSEFSDFYGKKVTFDYSAIRPKGSSLSYGVGKAPGHEPLEKALEKIRQVFNNSVDNGNKKLRTIDAYDIIMHASDAVLSGGVRRCIAEGSRVLIKGESFKAIEDVKAGDLVSTADGWQKVTNFFEQGEQSTVLIKHQDGELECTPNHRVAVLTNHLGEFEWKMASELQSGDRLAFFKNNDDLGVNKLPDFEYVKPDHSTTCKDISIPELDEGIAWLLGEFHGDGYVLLTESSGEISIACEGTNPEKAIRIQSELMRFGTNVSIQEPKENDNCYKIRTKSKQLATYFYSWLKQPKSTIRIPECIKKGTHLIKLAYIQGVLDADGSIGSRCQQVVCTVYPEFAKDIQSLLYSLGIASRFRELSRGMHMLDHWQTKYGVFIVNNEDRELFNECELGYKKFRKSLCHKKSNSYPIEFFNKINKEELPSGWSKKIANNSKRIPYSTWNRVFGESNIVPIEVKEVIDSGRMVKTYDIEVESNHNFICEGILVHNSATLAMFSVDDELMLNAKIGNWYYENPQRARSNNSALLLKNSTGREDYHRLFESTRQFGEPGIIWSHSTEQLFNPCVTADTIIATKDGTDIVSELIGKQFNALVDGKAYFSNEKGFWKTGNKEVVKLAFASGRELKCTPNHQILTVDGWKEAKDITSEDKVIINNHSNFNDKNIDIYSSDYAKGYLLGSFIGDGNLSRESAEVKWWGENRHNYRKDGYELIEQAGFTNGHHGCSVKEDSINNYVGISSKKLYEFAKEKMCLSTNEDIKCLSKKAITGSWSYLSGLIAGYFDADGTVSFNQEKGNSIRITSVQNENLINLQIALNSFGILSKIYKNRRDEGFRMLPDGNGGKKEYYTKASHEIHVSGEGIETFFRNIKIRNENKLDKVKKIVDSRKRMPNRSVFLDNVVLKSDFGKEDVYDCTIPEVSAFDANGVYVHNCVEIGLYGYDEQGNSGWQACNLCTINGAKLQTKENFALAAKVASIIGTLQAGYTDFDYLGKVSESIIRREALLGVSMTGIMDYPNITLDKNNLREMAGIVLQTNEDIANKIGINIAARTTCVKPEGTASCLLGTSSGIHPAHARRYIRRVQSNATETPIQHFKLYNPTAVETSLWSANGTDEVISFLIEMPEHVITKDGISAVQLLETVKLVQENWVEAGKRPEKCVHPWMSHNVSNTINVKESEWEDVEEFIYKNRESFAGISLLPSTGDLDYQQAPFTKVLTVEEIVEKYGKSCIYASGLIVDGLHAFHNNLWRACDAALGVFEVQEPKVPEKLNDEIMQKLQLEWVNCNLQKDWVRRAKQFAERHLQNNIKELTYLLKDINNNKLWEDLNRVHKDVDYTDMYEEEDNTKLMENVACAGGACSVF